MPITHQLGLIGYPLSHSFSKKYFAEKFAKANISNFDYELFPIEQIADLPNLIKQTPNLLGLNVTIPYKVQVIPYLDEIEEEAEKVGAVNTIRFENGKLKGYNTDIYGFEHSLLDLLQSSSKPLNQLKALVLGTGGASKAVVHVLDKLEIFSQLVSRSKKNNVLTYDSLDTAKFKDYNIVINTTPLGTYPNVQSCPLLPYDAIQPYHYFYDLVYNPAESLFLNKGKQGGASIKNGSDMLVLQAEKAWSIWTA